MQVLLTPIGSAGDNFPFIGLGAELVRRGHEVALATTDNFAPAVRQAGLEHLSTGTAEEYARSASDPDLWHPWRGYPTVARMVLHANRRLLPIVQDRMRRGRTIVVAHTLDLASRALAEARGLGVVALHLQPTILRSVHEVPSIGTKDISGWPRSLKRLLWWLVDRTYIDPPLAPGINQLRAELGLSPVSRIFAQHIHSPLLTLAMFPDWFAAPQPDWPPSLRQTMFPLYDRTGGTGCDQLEAFCAAGAPPVAFTPGSAFLFGQRFFQAAAQACEALGQRGLLLTSHVEQVPAPLPPNVIHVPFAPLSRILPLCAALVHHGGIGTTAAGLAAGVPQVIMPMSHDQPDNAARVMRLGVGERIMPKRFTGSSLGAALQRLLGSGEVRRRCAELAARCRAADGISQACDLIEQAAANA